MADVFISYKRERRPAARHLEQILVRYGYSVWFDLALVRGADYEDQIQQQLAAAKAVVVLWCGLSVQSPGVRSEASRAKAQSKLVPVKIEACELPLFSTLEQNIDLAAASGSPRDHALDPLLDDLERLVGRPPVADLRSLRDYEATWRTMGALPLARFPLEPVATPDDTSVPPQPSPSVAPAHDYAFWERQWDKQAAGENLIALRAIAEDAPRYFADQARARIAEIEAEQRRRWQPVTEAQKREAREDERRVATYRAEGGIKVDAASIHGAPKDAEGAGWFKPGAGKTEWFKDLDAGPEMVVVPAGSFMMGSPDSEPEREPFVKGSEGPQQRVVIAQRFAVGRDAVTRGQFAAFVNNTGYKTEGGAFGWTGTEWKLDPKFSWRNPGFAQDDGHPVVCVNWDDAKAYVQWLCDQSGKAYRLLSDAEWEYVARAGTTTPF